MQICAQREERERERERESIADHFDVNSPRQLLDRHNRWFDKLMLIVNSNGLGGMLMEHTPLDAPAAVE
jgi:hypothetical protein